MADLPPGPASDPMHPRVHINLLTPTSSCNNKIKSLIMVSNLRVLMTIDLILLVVLHSHCCDEGLFCMSGSLYMRTSWPLFRWFSLKLYILIGQVQSTYVLFRRIFLRELPTKFWTRKEWFRFWM
jgi:hypothetical protein